MKNFKLYFFIILLLSFFSCGTNDSDKNQTYKQDMTDLNSDSSSSEGKNKEQIEITKVPEYWDDKVSKEILQNVQIKVLMASMVSEEKWENSDFIKSGTLEYCFDTMYFEGILLRGVRSESISLEFWVDEKLHWRQDLGQITKEGKEIEFISDLGHRGTLYFLLGDKIFKKVEIIPIGCT